MNRWAVKPPPCVVMKQADVVHADRTDHKWYALYGEGIGSPTAGGDTPLEALGKLMIQLEQAGVITISWPSGRIPEEVS